jgi:hypothetical protein
MKPPVKFQWRGNHHLYYGIFFVVFGLFNWEMGIDNGYLESLIPFWQSFVVVGAYFIADDIVEHVLTSQTPLRLLFEYLFRKRIK